MVFKAFIREAYEGGFIFKEGILYSATKEGDTGHTNRDIISVI